MQQRLILGRDGGGLAEIFQRAASDLAVETNGFDQIVVVVTLDPMALSKRDPLGIMERDPPWREG